MAKRAIVFSTRGCIELNVYSSFPFQSLLDRYTMSTMEEVFLHLSSHEDEDERMKNGSGSTIVSTSTSSSNYLESWGSSAGGTLGRLSLVSATLRRGSFSTAALVTAGSEDTLRRNMSRNVVYPGITAMAEDCGVQPISYYRKTEAETEFQKIKRRLSMKVTAL
jgi:hypothetical protein